MVEEIMRQRTWRIYKITCRITQKSYIGLTCDSLSQRWSNHVCKALKLPTKSKSLFQHAIAKYGRDAFVIDVLALAASLEDASLLERLMIATHNTIRPSGYNLSEGGMGSPGVRRPHSAETRAKIGEANKGRIFSAETRAKMSRAKKGGTLTIEHRQKVAIAGIGRQPSLETRQRIADAARGRSFPRRSLALLKSQIAGGAPSSTGFRGVIPEGRNWTARIGINGRRVQIGTYKTKEEAAAAYANAVHQRIRELEQSIEI